MTTELNESSLIEEAFVLNLRRPLEVDGALQWSGIIRIVVKTANGFSTVDADVTVPAGADASFGHLFEACLSGCHTQALHLVSSQNPREARDDILLLLSVKDRGAAAARRLSDS